MSIASEITRLQTAKADIKTAIEAKGVTVPSSAKLDDYDTYVSQISGGGGSSKISDLIEASLTTMTASDFDGATAIKQSCFEGCYNLTSVTVPSSVTSVGSWAFKNCTGLTSITFQGSIGAWAAAGSSYGHNGVFQSSGLTSFTFPPVPTGQTSIGYLDSMFKECTQLQTLDLRNLNIEITSGGKPASMCNGCTALTTVLMPQAIGKYFYSAQSVFNGCTNLTNITLPPIIETGTVALGSQFFNNCTSLITITIPDSIYGFGQSAFKGCTSLTTVNFPSTVTTGQYLGTGSGIFQECTSLNNITLPEGLTRISTNTFYNCSALTNVTLPSTLTTIYGGAFGSCANLTELTFNGTMTQWGSITFGAGSWKDSTLTTVHCSDGDITL